MHHVLRMHPMHHALGMRPMPHVLSVGPMFHAIRTSPCPKPWIRCTGAQPHTPGRMTLHTSTSLLHSCASSASSNKCSTPAVHMAACGQGAACDSPVPDASARSSRRVSVPASRRSSPAAPRVAKAFRSSGASGGGGSHAASSGPAAASTSTGGPDASFDGRHGGATAATTSAPPSPRPPPAGFSGTSQPSKASSSPAGSRDRGAASAAAPPGKRATCGGPAEGRRASGPPTSRNSPQGRGGGAGSDFARPAGRRQAACAADVVATCRTWRLFRGCCPSQSRARLDRLAPAVRRCAARSQHRVHASTVHAFKGIGTHGSGGMQRRPPRTAH
eukprot:364224-Chlamydomonas_euryale.AAC.3